MPIKLWWRIQTDRGKGIKARISTLKSLGVS